MTESEHGEYPNLSEQSPVQEKPKRGRPRKAADVFDPKKPWSMVWFDKPGGLKTKEHYQDGRIFDRITGKPLN